MKIPVFFRSYKSETPNYGYWDYQMIEDVLSGELWNCVDGYEYEFNYDNLPLGFDVRGGVVVIPARYHFDKVEEINEDIKGMDWVVLILVGDEDGAFPTEKIVHPNKKVYLMLPHKARENVDRYIPNGYPANTRERMKKFGEEYLRKEKGWFFAGQVTHKRRKECVKELRSIPREVNNGLLIETEAFTQGVPLDEFQKFMVSSKVAICPSGAVVPDSFRLYEALEGGCFPIVDNKSPNDEVDDFWKLVFGDFELPFMLVNSWKDIVGSINFHNDVYPHTANRVFAWWMKVKRDYCYGLRDDIASLGNHSKGESLKDKISVIIPTSFIKSHPSTEIIEEVIRSVRERLPDSEIFLTFDGLRSDHEVYKSQYEEYIRRMLWKCHHEYHNVLPIVFESHKHQIGMAREVINMVRTPLVLYVEHDAPLCEEIPFEELSGIILRGEGNVIRLHHEALILAVHKFLMLDQEPIMIGGLPMVRTGQWSQRPHLASTEFYRKILFEFFKPEAYGMIEDGILGRVQESFFKRGQAGWNENKVMIYAPERDMKRSYHLDGRGSESKFEETFKYV